MHYQLHFLDTGGKRAITLEWHCADERRVITLFSRIEPRSTVELWTEDRLVARQMPWKSLQW